MPWRQPSDPGLAEAVVASFRQSRDEAIRDLSRFNASAWRKTWYWLDASGLPLYFLQRAEQAGFIDAIDDATVLRLRGKHQTNRERTAALFEEFIAINRAFLHERVIYANLKGFTLTPHSCPSPELRLQLDLDFLVPGQYLKKCRAVLESRGYELTGVNASSWEFKAGRWSTSSNIDPYRANACRSVELHFNLDGMTRRPVPFDERLDRLSVWHYQGHSFPTLSPQDQIIAQALHLLSHLRNASTRPAWLLEFQRHASFYKDDVLFWSEVRELARVHPLIPVALGVSVISTRELFGSFKPASIADWAEHAVPPGVRLWLQRFGRRAIMADFPGTKLYLLLNRELNLGPGQTSHNASSGLLPALRVPRLFDSRPPENFHDRVRAQWMQLRYVLFRLRFHAVESIRALWAATTWKPPQSPRHRTLRTRLQTLCGKG